MWMYSKMVSNYVRQNLALLKGEIGKPIIMIGDFKTLL